MLALLSWHAGIPTVCGYSLESRLYGVYNPELNTQVGRSTNEYLLPSEW